MPCRTDHLAARVYPVGPALLGAGQPKRHLARPVRDRERTPCNPHSRPHLTDSVIYAQSRSNLVVRPANDVASVVDAPSLAVLATERPQGRDLSVLPNEAVWQRQVA